MNRLVLLVSAIALLSGCSNDEPSLAAGVGDPCVPHDEDNPNFSSFSAEEVFVETGASACETQVCLINKFQGRVTCPYGSTGQFDLCPLPGTDPISADPADKVNVAVLPQLVDRREDQAVYCSCRCANADGRTDDGGEYCACPSGFSCEQLVPDIGLGGESVAGGYCVKAGTNQVPTGQACSASQQNCPAIYDY